MTSTLRGPMAVLALVAMAGPAYSQTRRPPADRRNFVSCPIVRDTRTVPCWLAEFQGQLYLLGIQTDTSADWYPPQLGHDVLVEGVVESGPLVCGGIPLKPVTTSVMPELNPACGTILPAEPGIEAPHAERGPGPSSERRAAGTPPQVPAPPFAARTFAIPFDFDSDVMLLRVTRRMEQAVRYAKAIGPARIEVTGYRGATLLSDGRIVEESPQVAERRASKLGAILQGLGMPSVVTWKTSLEPADGVKDAERRRADVIVTPAGTAGKPK